MAAHQENHQDHETEHGIDELLRRLNQMYGSDTPADGRSDGEHPSEPDQQDTVDEELRLLLERAIADGEADPNPSLAEETSLPAFSEADLDFHLSETVAPLSVNPVAAEETQETEPVEIAEAEEPLEEEIPESEEVIEITEAEEPLEEEIPESEEAVEIAEAEEPPEEVSESEEVIELTEAEEPLEEEIPESEEVIEITEAEEPPEEVETETALRFAEEGILAQEQKLLEELEADSEFLDPEYEAFESSDSDLYEQFSIDSLLDQMNWEGADGAEELPKTEFGAGSADNRSFGDGNLSGEELRPLPPEFGDVQTLSDDDIRMLLGLGYERELGNLIGYDRIDLIRREGSGGTLTELRRRHKKQKKKAASPKAESVLSEYTDRDQNFEIREKFRRERKHLFVRLCGTLIFAVILLVYDMPWLFGIGGFGVLNPVQIPGIYAFVGLQLLLLCALFSYRQLLSGVRKAAMFESDLYTIPVLLAILNAVYDFLLLFFSISDSDSVVSETGTAPTLFHFVVALYFLAVIGGEFLKLKRGEKTFESVAEECDRYTLEHTSTDPDGNREYRVRKTGFLTGVISRLGDEMPMKSLNILMGGVFLFSLLMAAGEYILTKRLTDCFSAFMSAITVCTPLSVFLAATMPEYLAAERLRKRGCAVIGDGAVREFATDKTVIFREEDLFHAGSRVGFSASGKRMLSEQFLLCSRLFRRIGGTLGTVIELAGDQETLGKVDITEVADMGLSARIDDRIDAVVGSVSYLESHGIPVPEESAERTYLRKSDCVPLYIAFDGVVCLELEMTYRLEEETEYLIRELSATGNRIGVNVCDPCLTPSFVDRLRRLEPDQIHLYRATHVERDDRFDAVDSGISAPAPKDLRYPLGACRKLRSIRSVISAVEGIAAGVSALFVTAFLLGGMLDYLSGIYIALYQLIWHIPVLVTIWVQFKQEGKKSEK